MYFDYSTLPAEVKKRVRVEYTGTQFAYENYHGNIYIDGDLITEWSYDKKQSKFIASLSNGKRFYRNSVHGLVLGVFKEVTKLKYDKEVN